MKVFISHIHEEASIAKVIKETIESAFAGQCKVFLSSDRHDIPAGKKWLNQLKESLRDASALLVLCSQLSRHRPWINFETGCGWIKDICVIPICHSGLTEADLPIQLSTFQALNVADTDFVSNLTYSLVEPLHLSEVPQINEQAIRADLERVCSDLRKKNRKIEVWADEDFPEKGGTTYSFAPQPRMHDLIEEVARKVGLSLAEYSIQWCLRDERGHVLSRDEGVVRNFRASVGLQQLLVLTKPPPAANAPPKERRRSN